MTERVSGSVTHLLEGVAREEIKITEGKHTLITYKPADGSYVHECGPVVLTKYDVGVVEIFTDQGLVGIGPCESSNGEDYAHLIGKAKGVPVYQLLATDHPTRPPGPHDAYASGGVMWTYLR